MAVRRRPGARGYDIDPCWWLFKEVAPMCDSTKTVGVCEEKINKSICAWRDSHPSNFLVLGSLLLNGGFMFGKTNRGWKESACFTDKRNLHLRQHPAGEVQKRRGSSELVLRESDSLRRFRKHACPHCRLIWQQKIASWSSLTSHTEEDSQIYI